MVEICTQYAQKGMFNIFLAVFFSTLAFACFEPYFFIGYLISIAIFGLFQAIFMANAGGAWDNAKKIVEVELQGEGHAAARGHRRRRHGRRPVQGHLLGGDEPGHQVHDALRPAGRRAGGRDDRRGRTRLTHDPRRGLLRRGAGLRLPLVLRHAHPQRVRSREPLTSQFGCIARKAPERSGAFFFCRRRWSPHSGQSGPPPRRCSKTRAVSRCPTSARVVKASMAKSRRWSASRARTCTRKSFPPAMW